MILNMISEKYIYKKKKKKVRYCPNLFGSYDS